MFYLKRNLPIWERVLRLFLAMLIGFGASYFSVGDEYKILTLITAGVLACTAFIGFCPACAMLGRKVIGPKK